MNTEVQQGDCLDVLDEMDDGAIDLCFTSPPYANAINYEEHVETLDRDEKWERDDLDYETYKAFLCERFGKLLEKTKEGGYCVVNIAPVTWDGERIPLPMHFTVWMENIGWEFCEDIIWEKPIAKDRRSGVLIQHPYPGYYYPSNTTEYVFVFRRPGPPIYDDRDEGEKEQSRVPMGDYNDDDKSKDVWKIRPSSPGENEHPAPFPTELAERVIQFYSYKGDTVVDIFNGSGTTGVAASKLERDYVGAELLDEYVSMTRERLEEVQTGLSQYAVATDGGRKGSSR